MNDTLSFHCAISTYLNYCSTAKIFLLVPGWSLNICILLSLLSCTLSRRSGIRGNVAVFILGSASCNLVNLALWPLIIHWRSCGRWMLSARTCEVMVSLKLLTSTASFHYASFITFSVYLSVVCGCRRLVNSRLFLAAQLLSPLLPVGAKELSQWLLGTRVQHLDSVQHSCFSFINDKGTRLQVLVKTAVFLPLNLYFYAHVLYTLVQSANLVNRSQTVNVHLAKVFSIITLITFTANMPGAAFSLMKNPSVCEEMVRELLLDLPLVASPVILLCTNNELRKHLLILLRRSQAPYNTMGLNAMKNTVNH